MSDSFLLYGATGYTGRLVARHALQRGMRPVLAGRDATAVSALARELGCEHRVASLGDAAALDRALSGHALVLHCAGPFEQTSAPMAEACLRAGAHYLDITGEVTVFEALAARGEEAAKRGVVLLPGVGLDVVPSDCLALHLKARLPSATRLAIAVRTLGRASRGTTRTMLAMLPRGGLVRRGGALVRVPLGHRVRDLDFGHGPRTVVAAPWGDLSTAFHSTGIPDIETYLTLPGAVRRALPLLRVAGPALATGAAQRLLGRLIDRASPGPDEQERRTGRSHFWGEVEDAGGRRCVARLHAPEGYTLTALTAVAAAREVLAGRAQPGFRTPASAFGADWILGFAGVEREDVA